MALSGRGIVVGAGVDVIVGVDDWTGRVVVAAGRVVCVAVGGSVGLFWGGFAGKVVAVAQAPNRRQTSIKSVSCFIQVLYDGRAFMVR
jgi:hypothetical protein